MKTYKNLRNFQAIHLKVDWNWTQIQRSGWSTAYHYSTKVHRQSFTRESDCQRVGYRHSVKAMRESQKVVEDIKDVNSVGDQLQYQGHSKNRSTGKGWVSTAWRQQGKRFYCWVEHRIRTRPMFGKRKRKERNKTRVLAIKWSYHLIITISALSFCFSQTQQ